MSILFPQIFVVKLRYLFAVAGRLVSSLVAQVQAAKESHYWRQVDDPFQVIFLQQMIVRC